MKSVFVLLSIFMLLCITPFSYGSCLKDGDTSHTAADYARRLWSYVSKSPVQPSTSSDLKFMTINQQSGFLTSCKSDPAAQATYMKGMDYVGTQETVQGVDTRCNCNIPQIIADVAGMATSFVMAIPYRTGQYGTNIGTSQTVRDTKWGLLDYPGVEQRVVVAVKTKPEALKGRNLWFINVHVEYYNGAARQSQIAQIHTFVNNQIIIPDPTAVVVMVGDFNGGPWDAGYATMKAQGYTNSWETFNGGILEGNTIPVDWPGSRFDHIWFRQPAGVTVTVKDVKVLDVRLSDHRPVVATLNFRVSDSGSTATTATTKSSSTVTTASATTGTTGTATGSGGGGSSSDVVCVTALWEGSQLNLACPKSGQKITQVQFASYGTPSGTCGNYKLGSCIGGSSMAVMVDKCVGRSSCSFPIANNVFGDPCPKTGKYFSTQVLCA